LLLLVFFVKIEADWCCVIEDKVILATWTRHYVNVGTRMVDVHNVVNDVGVWLDSSYYFLVVGSFFLRCFVIIVVCVVSLHIDVIALLLHLIT
jgi:hypothetical protein